jgi:hypothetical protein
MQGMVKKDPASSMDYGPRWIDANLYIHSHQNSSLSRTSRITKARPMMRTPNGQNLPSRRPIYEKHRAFATVGRNDLPKREPQFQRPIPENLDDSYSGLI